MCVTGLLLRSNPQLNIFHANACCGRRELSHQVESGCPGFVAIPYAPRQLSDLNAVLSEKAKTIPTLTRNGPHGLCPGSKFFCFDEAGRDLMIELDSFRGCCALLIW
jgi:hypothetical protein